MKIQQLNIYQECIFERETHQQTSKRPFRDHLDHPELTINLLMKLEM